MPLPIRVAADTLPALIVGALLTLVSVAMSLNQWRRHRLLLQDSKLDEHGYAYAERQIRRRLQISGLLFLVGVLIPLGDQLDFFFRRRPGLFFVYWVGVLLLVGAIVLLAAGDFLSTVAYTRLAGLRLRVERRQLEEEIRRYRARQNGHAGDGEANDSQG